MVITIGIDPGKTGALAVVGDGTEVLFLDHPPTHGTGAKSVYDAAAMNRMVAPWGRGRAYHWEEQMAAAIERVQAAEDDDDAFFANQDILYALVKQRKQMLSRTVALAVIENQQSRAGSAPQSVLATGRGWGMWLGILAANGIPTERVSTLKWQGALGCKLSRPKDDKLTDSKWLTIKKAHHVAQAVQLFPTEPRLTKSKDGFADALLQAVYAHRVVTGRQ